MNYPNGRGSWQNGPRNYNPREDSNPRHGANTNHNSFNGTKPFTPNEHRHSPRYGQNSMPGRGRGHYHQPANHHPMSHSPVSAPPFPFSNQPQSLFIPPPNMAPVAYPQQVVMVPDNNAYYYNTSPDMAYTTNPDSNQMPSPMVAMEPPAYMRHGPFHPAVLCPQCNYMNFGAFTYISQLEYELHEARKRLGVVTITEVSGDPSRSSSSLSVDAPAFVTTPAEASVQNAGTMHSQYNQRLYLPDGRGQHASDDGERAYSPASTFIQQTLDGQQQSFPDRAGEGYAPTQSVFTHSHDRPAEHFAPPQCLFTNSTDQPPPLLSSDHEVLDDQQSTDQAEMLTKNLDAMLQLNMDHSTASIDDLPRTAAWAEGEGDAARKEDTNKWIPPSSTVPEPEQVVPAVEEPPVVSAGTDWSEEPADNFEDVVVSGNNRGQPLRYENGTPRFHNKRGRGNFQLHPNYSRPPAPEMASHQPDNWRDRTGPPGFPPAHTGPRQPRNSGKPPGFHVSNYNSQHSQGLAVNEGQRPEYRNQRPDHHGNGDCSALGGDMQKQEGEAKVLPAADVKQEDGEWAATKSEPGGEVKQEAEPHGRADAIGRGRKKRNGGNGSRERGQKPPGGKEEETEQAGGRDGEGAKRSDEYRQDRGVYDRSEQQRESGKGGYAHGNRRDSGRGRDYTGPKRNEGYTQRGGYNNMRREYGSSRYQQNYPASVKPCDFIKEVTGDLFQAPGDHSLAHCVAADMRMGAGIAVQFKQKFAKIGELLDQAKDVGEVAILPEKDRFIYYLVTKALSSGKPTMDTLRNSLTCMKDHCVEHKVKQLAVPKIGCGLDRLEWPRVHGLLEHLFADTGIHITVYSLPENDDAKEATPSRRSSLWVTHHRMNLADIQAGTGLLFTCAESNEVSPTMKSIDAKHPCLGLFHNTKRTQGELVGLSHPTEFIYGLVVKKTAEQPMSYTQLMACLRKLRKRNEKDYRDYFGIEAFRNNGDKLTMEKVISCFKQALGSVNYLLEVWVCWPKEVEGDHVWEDEVRPSVVAQ